MKCGYVIEVMIGKGKKWYWRLKYSNGKILAHSETYANRTNALQTATNLARHLGADIKLKDQK